MDATTICNMALSEAGNRAQQIASLAEDSPEAQQCSLWYDTMRRRLLRAAPWGFCRYQVSLTQLGDLIPDQTSPYPWLYKYALPDDYVKMRYLVPPPFILNGNGTITPPSVGSAWPAQWGLSPSRSNRFIIASDLSDDMPPVRRNVILSNVCEAIGVYNGDVTDPDLFDELFVGALASAIAFKIVIPLNGNVGEREQFRKTAEDAVLQARVADGNEAVPRSDVQVDWITTRGIGSDYGYGAGPGYGANASWGQWLGMWDEISWAM